MISEHIVPLCVSVQLLSDVIHRLYRYIAVIRNVVVSRDVIRPG